MPLTDRSQMRNVRDAITGILYKSARSAMIALGGTDPSERREPRKVLRRVGSVVFADHPLVWEDHHAH